MSDYRYNPNNNTNYPQNTQRTGNAVNRPNQGRTVSAGAPINRPPMNRPNSNRPSQNRPIQNRPSQNTSVPIRGQENKTTPSEGLGSSEGVGTEGAYGSASTQGKENISGSRKINGAEKPSYSENSDNNYASQRTQNKLTDLLNLSNMNNKDILKGIVLSEILGKPKALKRGRW